MEYLFEKIRDFNTTWKDVPRRALLVLLTFVMAYIVMLLLPFFAPFVIAALIAWILKKPARGLENFAQRHRLPAKAMDALVVLLFYGITVVLLFLLGRGLAVQVPALIASIPKKLDEISVTIESWVEGSRNLIGDELLTQLLNVLDSATKKIMPWIAEKTGAIAAWTLDTAMAVPKIVLFVVLMIMGTFYFLAERARIWAFIHKWMPDPLRSTARSVRSTVFRGALGQLRAAVIMSAITAVELMIGFTIMRIQYGLALGFFIGVADVLPILGAGLFLIPMAIYGLISGNIALGLGCALLYGIVVVLRQIVEPRVVSVQLGLHPLETMIAMYAGLHAIGVAGMLLGPVILLFLHALLITSEPEPMHARGIIAKRQAMKKEKAAKERT